MGGPRVRPPRPEARRRAGAVRAADQGAQQRPPGHDRHCRLRGRELKSPGTEVFQHLFEILDYDPIKEVDLVEDIVGAPETPLPELDADTSPTLASSRSKLLQATPASTTPH